MFNDELNKNSNNDIKDIDDVNDVNDDYNELTFFKKILYYIDLFKNFFSPKKIKKTINIDNSGSSIVFKNLMQIENDLEMKIDEEIEKKFKIMNAFSNLNNKFFFYQEDIDINIFNQTIYVKGILKYKDEIKIIDKTYNISEIKTISGKKNFFDIYNQLDQRKYYIYIDENLELIVDSVPYIIDLLQNTDITFEDTMKNNFSFENQNFYTEIKDIPKINFLNEPFLIECSNVSCIDVYKMFDNNFQTSFEYDFNNKDINRIEVILNFDKQQQLTDYAFECDNLNEYPENIEIYGSNNLEKWDLLDSKTGISPSIDANTTIFHYSTMFNQDKFYKYFKIVLYKHNINNKLILLNEDNIKNENDVNLFEELSFYTDKIVAKNFKKLDNLNLNPDIASEKVVTDKTETSDKIKINNFYLFNSNIIYTDIYNNVTIHQKYGNTNIFNTINNYIYIGSIQKLYDDLKIEIIEKNLFETDWLKLQDIKLNNLYKIILTNPFKYNNTKIKILYSKTKLKHSIMDITEKFQVMQTYQKIFIQSFNDTFIPKNGFIKIIIDRNI